MAKVNVTRCCQTQLRRKTKDRETESDKIIRNPVIAQRKKKHNLLICSTESLFLGKPSLQKWHTILSRFQVFFCFCEVHQSIFRGGSRIFSSGVAENNRPPNYTRNYSFIYIKLSYVCPKTWRFGDCNIANS